MPTQHWSDNILVSQLNDDPAFTEDMDELVQQLDEDHPPHDVVVDLSGLTTFGSANLSQLLVLRQHMDEQRRRLVLVMPSKAIWSIFQTAGLDQVFHFVKDVATALAELQIEARQA